MPDTLVSFETPLSPGRSTRRIPSRSRPFLDADQMRALWLDVVAASTNWDANDEKRSGEIATTAFDRIADARTVDPIGIGYKLLATRQWPTDHRKGMAEDLHTCQHDRVQSLASSTTSACWITRPAIDLPAPYLLACGPFGTPTRRRGKSSATPWTGRTRRWWPVQMTRRAAAPMQRRRRTGSEDLPTRHSRQPQTL